MAKTAKKTTRPVRRPVRRPAIDWKSRAERAEEEVLYLRDLLGQRDAEIAELKAPPEATPESSPGEDV